MFRAVKNITTIFLGYVFKHFIEMSFHIRSPLSIDLIQSFFNFPDLLP